jgi:hypothetical protein
MAKGKWEVLVNDVPALKALRLVNVWCDGSYDLVSLATGTVVCSGGECDLSVPTVEVSAADEVDIATLAGLEPGDGFPGFDAVIAWLIYKGVA